MLVRWLINAIALVIVSYLVPGFTVSSFAAALVAALILGLVNASIRPILLILTLPITIVTLGFFTLVLNALMLLLVSNLTPGFQIAGFGSAFLGGIILWLVSLILNLLTGEPRG